MMPHFERLGSAWNTPNEAALIEDVYREMPSYNISSICQQYPTAWRDGADECSERLGQTGTNRRNDPPHWDSADLSTGLPRPAVQSKSRTAGG